MNGSGRQTRTFLDGGVLSSENLPLLSLFLRAGTFSDTRVYIVDGSVSGFQFSCYRNDAWILTTEACGFLARAVLLASSGFSAWTTSVKYLLPTNRRTFHFIAKSGAGPGLVLPNLWQRKNGRNFFWIHGFDISLSLCHLWRSEGPIVFI